MRIAVLGGGNGSYAAAADLSLLGHEVRFWRRDAMQFGELAATRRLMLKDIAGRREVTIATVTDDLAAALRGAELILIPTPAFAQEDIARAGAATGERGADRDRDPDRGIAEGDHVERHD